MKRLLYIVIISYICVGYFSLSAHEECVLSIQDQTLALQNECVHDNEPDTLAVIQKEEQNSCCTICWHSFAEVDRVVLYPCRHQVCTNCSSEWFFKKARTICPTCAKKVRKVGTQKLDQFNKDSRSFLEKVDICLQQLLQKSYTIKECHGIVGAINAIETYRYPGQLKRYMAYMRQYVFHELYVAHQHISQQQEIRSAFLIKSGAQVMRMMRNFLIETLNSIDSHRTYWQNKLNSSKCYFLPRSVTKCFISRKQRFKIDTHIAHLDALYSTYCSYLGQINRYANTFEPDSVFEEYCNWLHGLLQLSKEVFGLLPTQTPHSLITIDMLCDDIDMVLSAVMSSKKQLKDQIGIHAQPSHLSRYWLMYTLAITGTGYGIWYTRKHPQCISDAIALLKRCYVNTRDGVKEGVDNIKTYFAGVNDQEPALDTQKIDKITAEMKKSINEVNTEIQELTTTYLEKAQKAIRDSEHLHIDIQKKYRDVVANFSRIVNEYNSTLESNKKLPEIELLKKKQDDPLDQVYLERLSLCMEDFVNTVSSNIKNTQQNIGFMNAHSSLSSVAKDSGFLAEAFTQYGSALSLWVRISKMNGTYIIKDVLERLNRVGANVQAFPLNDLVDLFSKQSKEGLTLMHQASRTVNRDARLTIGAIILAPFAGALYGIYKGVRHVCKFSVHSVEHTLDAIDRVLNKGYVHFDVEQEGALVYLVQKMKEHVITMPGTVSIKQRRLLLSDVRELESSMEAVQKIRTVERLRRSIERLF